MLGFIWHSIEERNGSLKFEIEKVGVVCKELEGIVFPSYYIRYGIACEYWTVILMGEQ